MSLPYDHEEDDAYFDKESLARYTELPSVEWEQDYSIKCAYCHEGTRVPGSPVCRFCDWRSIPHDAWTGLQQFEALLLKNAPWSLYQVEHGLI